MGCLCFIALGSVDDTGGVCSYQEVCGGGGLFVDRPSPPNARAATSILRAAGQASAASMAKKMSVLKAVEGMEGPPRCDETRESALNLLGLRQ
jgi:hypothetical protein